MKIRQCETRDFFTEMSFIEILFFCSKIFYKCSVMKFWKKSPDNIHQTPQLTNFAG